MEEDMQVVSEVPVTKTVAAELSADPVEAVNGELPPVPKEGMKEDEETTLDGGFIKVEKESLDFKDSSRIAEPASSVAHEGQSVIDGTSSGSSRELLETQEKVKELEVELERVVRLLKNTESDNVQLKEELSHAQGKSQLSAKRYDDLELSHKKLQEQVTEAEERYKSELMALQEALEAQEVKHQELISVKESFNGLNLELESSRKRLQELEDELQHSAGEARKFEELHRESHLNSETQMQKALEFERLLEVAKLSAKEVEDQVTSLQEEIKLLYEKIAENKNVEEALEKTARELASLQDQLTQSKSLLANFEQNLLSKEGLLNELMQELELRKGSESQMKGEFLALEDVLASTKIDLQAKVKELEEIKLKLENEMKVKEAFEAQFTTREAELAAIREKLEAAIAEKGTLEATVAELNTNATQMKELCADLENKLKLSDENLCETDSLLSQALSKNEDLEEKLKSLKALHDASGAAVATTNLRNLELEGLIKTSTTEAEEAKSQMREVEIRLIATEQKNFELDQELNLVLLRFGDAEREVKELSDKVSELSALLRGVEGEKDQLRGLVKEYYEKISQLEASLSQSALRNSELEEELKIVSGKCAEHDDRANMNHQRSLELEDLIKMSQSKVEDASKKTNEMELLLEAEKYRIQELEEQISSLEKKCAETETETQNFSNKAAELAVELEAFQARSSSLEITVQIATEKEKELTECLNVATEEKKRLEDETNKSNVKLAEMESLLGLLKEELSVTQQRLESLENELKAAGLKENEVSEKLKFAEEQIEQQVRALEEAAARDSELRAAHKSLTRDFELKLQEATTSFSDKDSEAKSLMEKLKILEDQTKDYEVQVVEASGQSASLKEELASLENELKAAGLKENEVSEKLKFAEEQIEQQVRALEEAAARDSELRAAHKSLTRDFELKLQEATTSFSDKDSEAKSLMEKLKILEDQTKDYEVQVVEASGKSASLKEELDLSMMRVASMETTVEELKRRIAEAEDKASQALSDNGLLVETNVQLKQRVDELQEFLKVAVSEKEAIAGQLASHVATITELQGQYSHALGLQSATEARILEAEKQLEEAVGKFSKKDEEAKDLNDKLSGLESQLRLCEEEAHKASTVAEKQKIELEVALSQLKDMESFLEEVNTKLGLSQKENEGLANVNLNLTQDLAEYESKWSDVQTKLSAAIAEKGNILEQLELSKKAAEELTEQLTSEGHTLKSQISSLREENSLVKENHSNSKRELQSVIDQLEEQVQSQQTNEGALKSEIESLKAELVERSKLETYIKELEEKISENILVAKEGEAADSEKELEREAALKQSLEKLEEKSKEAAVLETRVKELEQKQKLAEAALLDKETAASQGEIKSRDIGDIGSPVSTSSRRKSKRKTESSSVHPASTPSGTQLQTSEAHAAMSFKFILGVVIVSIILGIILGKKY